MRLVDPRQVAAHVEFAFVPGPPRMPAHECQQDRHQAGVVVHASQHLPHPRGVGIPCLGSWPGRTTANRKPQVGRVTGPTRRPSNTANGAYGSEGRPPWVGLQFALQFIRVRHGSRRTAQRRWSSLNRSGRLSRELLMRLRHLWKTTQTRWLWPGGGSRTSHRRGSCMLRLPGITVWPGYVGSWCRKPGCRLSP